MEALLIIDIQVGSFQTPRFEADKVIENINLLSTFFRTKNQPVIFIQHDGTKENFLVYGNEEWHILPSLTQKANDYYIEKEANDCFYKTELEALLQKLDVQKLYLCGCATDFCVNATVHGALVRDYAITVIKDGHTTADRPMITAEHIINFHNWLWENLTPTQSRIEVKNTQEIVK